MKIDLPNLPEDGLPLSGEIPPESFQLQQGDARPASPLKYQLWVQRFDNELLLTGELEMTFSLTCMRSLHPFLQTIFLPDTAISVEITEGGILDLTDSLQEEVLIELPTNPRCEEGDTEMTCEVDERYLAVDNLEDSITEPAPTHGGSTQEENPWAALDALDEESTEPRQTETP